MQNTIDFSKNQVLIDRHPQTGKRLEWEKKKSENEKLVNSLYRIEQYDADFKGRAYKCSQCGSFLEFRRYENSELKLNTANFCRYRLCPMCMWRRSLKIFAQTSLIMEAAKERKCSFLFLTLTIKNVTHEELSNSLDEFHKSFRRFTKKKEMKKIVKGIIRTYEITHNVEHGSDSFDTFHPHAHLIIAVEPKYFKSRWYIKQSEFQRLWQESARLEYAPIVDVRKIKPKKGEDISATIREVSKYCTKSNQFLLENEELTDRTVRTLHHALFNRRFVGYYGIFKKLKQEFNLDDAENGDLINLDGNAEINEELAYTLERYQWDAGYKQYIRNRG